MKGTWIEGPREKKMQKFVSAEKWEIKVENVGKEEYNSFPLCQCIGAEFLWKQWQTKAPQYLWQTSPGVI